MKITQERLKELLDYDPDTGVFTWKISRKGIKKKIAGSMHKNKGYLIIGLDSKDYKAHRLAFLYMEGYLPENDVDHIDRNRINNKWNNLREVSRSCNLRNCNISKINTSGITGVSWSKQLNKWKAQITILNKNISLGYFKDIADAATARWNSEVKHGFPNCSTTSSAYNYLKKQGVI